MGLSSQISTLIKLNRNRIAQEVKLIRNLCTYIDDNGSFAHVGDVAYYPPYGMYYPTAQMKLLKLWDKLNIPHTKKKQVYRPVIPYVGRPDYWKL